MKALSYYGPKDVRVYHVAKPRILAPTDVIVRVTKTAICGSDLHLYNGLVPTVKRGDILGHEFVGVVDAVGDAVRRVRPGDRVLVPFTIACGACTPLPSAERRRFATTRDPNAASIGDLVAGHSPGGLYGYSHAFGGYPGGQAEYVRVVFADANVFRMPADLEDERALFLTDVLPTGYQAAEQCEVKDGDIVAIWGCGPVGLFAIQSALLLGAQRVIAIDRLDDRLERARKLGAETVNFEREDAVAALSQRTGGRGPDAVIDCVGMEAHAFTVDALLDTTKQGAKMRLDRAHVLRQAIYGCAKGGIVSIAGVYLGLLDLFPLGAAFAKGLRFRMGQTNVHRYVPLLLEKIREGRIQPREIITHRFELDVARGHAYQALRRKDGHLPKNRPHHLGAENRIERHRI